MKKTILFLFILLLFSFNTKAQYTVGVSYFGDSNWIEYIPGDMPIIIVAPLHLAVDWVDERVEYELRGIQTRDVDLTAYGELSRARGGGYSNTWRI